MCVVTCGNAYILQKLGDVVVAGSDAVVGGVVP